MVWPYCSSPRAHVRRISPKLLSEFPTSKPTPTVMFGTRMVASSHHIHAHRKQGSGSLRPVCLDARGRPYELQSMFWIVGPYFGWHVGFYVIRIKLCPLLRIYTRSMSFGITRNINQSSHFGYKWACRASA